MQRKSNPTFCFSLLTIWAGKIHPFPFTQNRRHSIVTTGLPNMAKLASRGLRFTNAYACSICSPSRVSLMTGQNAARHKVTCWTLRKDTSPARPGKQFLPANWNLNGLQPAGDTTQRSIAQECLPELLRKGRVSHDSCRKRTFLELKELRERIR